MPNEVKCLFGGSILGSEPIANSNRNIYSFEQKVPIPTYLIVIAAGDVAFKAISERCGVWAEPDLLERACKEFEDTEKFLSTVFILSVYKILLIGRRVYRL